MAEVIVKRLTKEFGDVTAVDDVSLRVADGEFLVLLGPSGCGKSTILRLVAGLENATRGEITIDGALVNFKDPVNRNVAMVFQNYALYPHMTVRKNIAFPLDMAKMSREAIARSVGDAAAMLELEALLDRYPEQLSGGQRQRVALARAIVREPAAFLMDEPLSNLDAQLRVQTRLELMRLHQRLGVTTVYVTHDQTEAMTMGHRIAVMRDGVLQQVGRPEDVYNHPVNTFVAMFIGSPPMNLMDAVLKREGDEWHLSGSNFRIPTTSSALRIDEAALQRSGDQAVRLGIRAEDFRLDGGTGGWIQGRVQLREPVGSDLYLTVEVGQSTVQVRTLPNAGIAVGENVGLTFDPEKSHIFGEDGINLRQASRAADDSAVVSASG